MTEGGFIQPNENVEDKLRQFAQAVAEQHGFDAVHGTLTLFIMGKGEETRFMSVSHVPSSVFKDALLLQTLNNQFSNIMLAEAHKHFLTGRKDGQENSENQQ